MSLSKLPWSYFGPHHSFLEKQKFEGYYQDALSSTLLSPLGFSLSAAFTPGLDMSNPANMNALSPDEMERFQKLSNEFEPDVKVRISDIGWPAYADIFRVRWSRPGSPLTASRLTMPMQTRLLRQKQTYVCVDEPQADADSFRLLLSVIL